MREEVFPEHQKEGNNLKKSDTMGKQLSKDNVIVFDVNSVKAK